MARIFPVRRIIPTTGPVDGGGGRGPGPGARPLDDHPGRARPPGSGPVRDPARRRDGRPRRPARESPGRWWRRRGGPGDHAPGTGARVGDGRPHRPGRRGSWRRERGPASGRPGTPIDSHREPCCRSGSRGAALAPISPSRAGSRRPRSLARYRPTVARASAALTAERFARATSFDSRGARTGRCGRRSGPTSTATSRSRSSRPREACGGFGPAAERTFCATEWRVAPDSDRNGIRLTGGASLPVPTTDSFSLPVPVGAVQVPPSGEPIIKMVDGPVTGGYPVLGVIPSVDHGRLAQAAPGATLRFRRVSVADARRRARSIACPGADRARRRRPCGGLGAMMHPWT